MKVKQHNAFNNLNSKFVISIVRPPCIDLTGYNSVTSKTQETMFD